MFQSWPAVSKLRPLSAPAQINNSSAVFTPQLWDQASRKTITIAFFPVRWPLKGKTAIFHRVCQSRGFKEVTSRSLVSFTLPISPVVRTSSTGLLRTLYKILTTRRSMVNRSILLQSSSRTPHASLLVFSLGYRRSFASIWWHPTSYEAYGPVSFVFYSNDLYFT